MSKNGPKYIKEYRVFSTTYSTGALLSLGMNFKLHGLSFKLLYCLLSWMNVGYLIA